MQKLLMTTLAGFCAVLLAGCGLLRDNRHTQTIYVITSPEGARCELSNDKGTWYVSDTPAQIVITRSMYGLTVICRKPGYVATAGIVTAKAKNIYLTANPRSWATIQDPKVTYVYPEQVSVTMNRGQGTGL